MPVGAAIGVSGALGLAGSVMSSNAASKASQQQVALGQQSLGQQQSMFNTGLSTIQPFVDAGKSAASTLTGLLTPGPNQTQTLSQLPGFQFANDWGQRAVANQGSTLGFGGNTLAAASSFATGQAQQGFTGYAQLLQNLVNSGAGAAGSVFGNATQTGANMGNTLTGIGSAQAAGTLGSANALAGGLTGVGNTGINALLLSRLLPPGAGGSGQQGNNGLPTDVANNGSGVYSGDASYAGFG